MPLRNTAILSYYSFLVDGRVQDVKMHAIALEPEVLAVCAVIKKMHRSVSYSRVDFL